MLKVIELFAGVGSQTQALKNIGLEHEVVAISEIDKYAVQSYDAIHGKVNNLGDITKIDKLPYCDLLTYSFPCQSISVSGKMEGFTKGSGTRSGLLWEVERLLKIYEEKPKYLLLENVKNLVSKKFINGFEEWLDVLDDLGYNNYWQVLNAKDYGIPQNRERVFVVSIRKDIEQGYIFPNKETLNIRLKNMLDDEFEEKWIIEARQDKLMSLLPHNNFKHNMACEKTICKPKFIEIATTLTSRDRGITNFQGEGTAIISNKIKCLGHIKDTNYQSNRFYDDNGICPTIDTMQGGDREPKILTMNYKQKVKVRTNDVDYNSLKQLLISSKKKLKLSNKTIADKLNQPLTKIEHYFRNDKYFSIPDCSVWEGLKTLLDINTNEFDRQIMEFEERDGFFEKAERLYNQDGISHTLDTTSSPKIIQLGNYIPSNHDASRVVDIDGIPPTVKENHGTVTAIVIDKSIKKSVADNFKLQLNEIQRTDKDIFQAECEGGWQDNKIGIRTSQTIRANNNFHPCLDNNYVIRKLTPLECWRLMGFKDDEFNKAKDSGVSNSQLYKQAGNSIVVNVLEKIFQNIFINKSEKINNNRIKKLSLKDLF